MDDETQQWSKGGIYLPFKTTKRNPESNQIPRSMGGLSVRPVVEAISPIRENAKKVSERIA